MPQTVVEFIQVFEVTRHVSRDHPASSSRAWEVQSSLMLAAVALGLAGGSIQFLGLFQSLPSWPESLVTDLQTSLAVCSLCPSEVGSAVLLHGGLKRTLHLRFRAHPNPLIRWRRVLHAFATAWPCLGLVGSCSAVSSCLTGKLSCCCVVPAGGAVFLQ